jgi:hypothetical protein
VDLSGSAANFRALEALMNQTPEGRRLVNLYWQNTAELVPMVLTNSALQEGTLQLFQNFQPGISALLAGDGGALQISPAMAFQANELAGVAYRARPGWADARSRVRAWGHWDCDAEQVLQVGTHWSFSSSVVSGRSSIAFGLSKAARRCAHR